MRRRSGDAARGGWPPEGRVYEVFTDAGYGFLESRDGRAVYFRRHSVLGGLFDRLSPGCRVRYAEKDGVQGPEASTVAVLDSSPLPAGAHGSLRCDVRSRRRSKPHGG